MDTCSIDDDCDFMYYCFKGVCNHKDIFPLQVYQVFVYLLIPLACGLCNLSGNSMGIFKITILMNLLRYTIDDATAIIQAVVIGSAIPNFLAIITERHLNGKTSLVNFNLVYIFIPCSLFGSTFGALLENFLPQLIQDILIVAMFTYFIGHFIKKYKRQLPKSQDSKANERQSLLTQDEIQDNQTLKIIEPKQSTQIKSKKPKLKKSKPKNPQIIQLRKQIKQYENSWHGKDILRSFIIFLIFETMAFFVQGKLPFFQFSKCQAYYPVGLFLLTVCVGLYLLFIKKSLSEKCDLYKKAKVHMEIDLKDSRTYWKFVLGGFGAGFVQGTLGVGAGTFLMVVMLAFPIDPRSAAATSGYQILFIGSGALTEQFINDKITIETATFFFLWTVISGSIVTILLYRFVKKLDQAKVRRFLLITIIFICSISLILLFPVAIQRIIKLGWIQMLSIHFKC